MLRKSSDNTAFLGVKWFKEEQVPETIENIEELHESDEEGINDSNQSRYEEY